MAAKIKLPKLFKKPKNLTKISQLDPVKVNVLALAGRAVFIFFKYFSFIGAVFPKALQ